MSYFKDKVFERQRQISVPDEETFSTFAAVRSATNNPRLFVNARVVTWYMGSGLKAQNMAGIRAQRRGVRAQKNGIRDHKAFEPKSGIRFITRSKNFLTQYFSAS